MTLLAAAMPARADVPLWLPQYDLDIHLDVEQHVAVVHESVTFTNRHARPANNLVFNAHSHFKLPDADIGMTAKTLEILRIMPSDALDTDGRCCEVKQVVLRGFGHSPHVDPVNWRTAERLPELLPRPQEVPREQPREIPFHYDEKNDTALIIPLPHPVNQGETVTVDLEFTITLPQLMGRWGQWKGVTFLSNWLPVLAVYDEEGWHPTPFIPWHQPFFNEAGIFTSRIVVQSEQTVACSAKFKKVVDRGDGWQEIETVPFVGRDFAVLCSTRFCEYLAKVGDVTVRVLAFKEHDFYARKTVESACQAIETYSRWFGPYPYPQFTLVESYFGWLGNECAGLVMIDNRIFAGPHVADGLVDSLVKHEICHQWWYNVVGTNGYCETWMDEGLATYFSYRLVYETCPRDDTIVKYPRLLNWLPNVRREDYRLYSLYGTIGRGEACATVQEMPKYGHLVNLMAMCYDKGGKIVGMIEERLGPDAFLDFMRIVYRKYQFRILRVADFQKELEAYTGQSWDQFFRDWLYGKGMTDWCIKDVKVTPVRHGWRAQLRCHSKKYLGSKCGPAEHIPCHVRVRLRQKAEIDEQTCLGFSFDGGESYKIRIPIVPQAPLLELDEYSTRIECLPHGEVLVDMDLPDVPNQVAVDPDQVLIDKEPANNFWKPRIRTRFTPLLTMLDETDLTNAYDRWNITIGPWFFTPTYENPWFTRSTRLGARASVYRTQNFDGGAYVAYRTDYRDVVAGVDGTWYHLPWDHTEFGFVFEQRLAGLVSGETQGHQGVLFGRYIIDYGDSLYLPPFQYVELFTTLQTDLLPQAREFGPGSDRFTQNTSAGIHYHINYLTPYWDAEGGFKSDISYSGGMTDPESSGVMGLHQFQGQVSAVKMLPEWTGSYLSQTKLAARAFGAYGVPDRINYYAMGGGELFRGFDLAQRQGNAVWVGSLEWRVPVCKHLTWDFIDHSIGIRNIHTAWFYDVGNVYSQGHSVGGTAHSVGTGLRVDISLFSLVERMIVRFDVAKTVNANTPVQFWFGMENPF